MEKESGTLHKGLKTTSPPAVDNSFKTKGGSVDSDTTRSSVAPQPKTLGPRDA